MRVYALETARRGDLDDHDNLLQSDFWADLKAASGLRTERFKITAEGSQLRSALSGREAEAAPLLVLLRRLPMGLCFAYVPHGPDIVISSGEEGAFLTWLTAALAPKLPANCAFIRYDLPWPITSFRDRAATPSGSFQRSPVDVQVPDTVEVDLSVNTDAILAAMKSKTRYNIRLAERKGVVVREGGADDMELWYDMARETAGRDGITLRGKSFFRTLFETAGRENSARVQLLVAEAENEPVAAIIITMQGSRCIYHYGASRSSKRNFMPTYALQWSGMLAAKAHGCTTYDLLGIPPTDDPGHPMHGLFRVKTGFGGRIVHRAGCVDAPLKPLIYHGFRIAELTRKLYYGKVRRLAFRG